MTRFCTFPVTSFCLLGRKIPVWNLARSRQDSMRTKPKMSGVDEWDRVSHLSHWTRDACGNTGSFLANLFKYQNASSRISRDYKREEQVNLHHHFVLKFLWDSQERNFKSHQNEIPYCVCARHCCCFGRSTNRWCHSSQEWLLQRRHRWIQFRVSDETTVHKLVICYQWICQSYRDLFHPNSFEQSDGQKRDEQGEVRNVGSENEAIAVRGSFSFVGDDGQTYTVTYVADENGFQPSAAHLPVA